jgi:choline dehydrogenase-like flavoprotein
MKRAIVVGTGAGGATAAKELQGVFDVTILEAGGPFRPFNVDLSLVEKVKRLGLLFDEREIQFLFPAMRIQKTADGMVLVKGIASGGTTTLATGNALRMDANLKAIGINLDTEFDELSSEVPVSTEHQKRWRPITKQLFEICKEMELNPRPTPKMVDYTKCIRCGECVLGCKQGAKWDSRNFLKMAVDKGARLVERCNVERFVTEKGTVIGVEARRGLKREFYPSDLVILAAGGFGTPLILENSGIECQSSMFVDPVLCVATEWKDAYENKEVPMPFVVQREHFIVSPYFDHLSFFFNRDWKYRPHNTLALMIKLADSNRGSITNKTVDKSLTDQDKVRLREGVDLCIDVLGRLGAKRENIFLGTLNAGHPGGMLPLTESEAVTFHHHSLPKNLYVADATLFPRSLGNPPIFTIMAMAKRISKLCMAIDAFSNN